MSISGETEKTEVKKTNVLFKELNADEDPEVTEIESLCLQCHGNGTTRMLLTKIPFYKEIVVTSFSCNDCHWENNSLQPASKIQEKGISFILKVLSQKDLARVVVKTEWASVLIPELEFEIPSQSQDGTVTTVEGVIQRTCMGLNSKLECLKVSDPDSAKKLKEFVAEMEKLQSGNKPFTFILRDCSGNSFLENLYAPEPDPQLEVSHFTQSKEECMMMGLYSTDEVPEEEQTNLKEEVLGLPTNCYSCNAPCVTNMKVTDVVIMSTHCEACGHKTNEVKSSSGIELLGSKATLFIEEHKDLTRDVLKDRLYTGFSWKTTGKIRPTGLLHDATDVAVSDTCSIFIKELDLEVGPAAFGSCYSTVEGILIKIKEQLIESNPFITGDSADRVMKEKLDAVLNKIDEIIKGERKATLILDDPCGNSYLQSIDYPNPDKNLVVEKYERSREQDEELGILDMKVENYEDS